MREEKSGNRMMLLRLIIFLINIYLRCSRILTKPVLVLLLKLNKKIMFLGDSAPIIVKDKLLSIGYSSEKPIKVDLIKLTHHGSKFNICNELIEMIDCDNFIISSNDRNFSKKLYQGYL